MKKETIIGDDKSDSSKINTRKRPDHLKKVGDKKESHLDDEEKKSLIEPLMNNHLYDKEDENAEDDPVQIPVSTLDILMKVKFNILALLIDFSFSLLFFINALQATPTCHILQKIISYLFSMIYLVGAAKQIAIMVMHFKIEGDKSKEVTEYVKELEKKNHNVMIFHFLLGLFLIIVVKRILSYNQDCGGLTKLYFIWLYIYNGLYIVCPLTILMLVYINHGASIQLFNIVINFFGVPKIEKINISKNKENSKKNN
jgi:hypothetical protein